MGSIGPGASPPDASAASSSTGDTTGDTPLQSFLHKSGVTASRIDPSSLQALCDIFSESSQRNKTVELDGPHYSKPNNVLFHSDSSPPTFAERELVIPETATPVERLILQQLREQSSLLLSMQRQIDQLAQQQGKNTLIERSHIQHGGAGSGATQPNMQTARPRSASPPLAPVPAPPLAVPPPPQRPPVVRGPGLWQRNMNAVHDTRVFKIVRLYSQLLRARLNNDRNNPGFDPLMLVKILVMLAILVSRIAPPRKNQHVDKDRMSWNFHFTIIAALVVPLFLYQTGILTFCYQFCFKYKYPARIWNGEDITLEQALEQQQRGAIEARVQNNAAAVPRPRLRNNHWLAALVMGAPPPQPRQIDDGAPELQPPPPAPAPLVVRVFQDVVIVLGSFVLSIFPMWRAIGPAEPPAPRNQPVIPEAPPHPDPDALPVVLPPADLADLEEDDDEEDGDDDGDSDDGDSDDDDED